jgi:translation initiation factor IF-1
MASNQGTFEVVGEITETLPNMMFRVRVTEGPQDLLESVLLCTLAGKMKMYRIRVLLGDFVRAQVSQYDKTRGRITFRVRADDPHAPKPAETVPTGPAEPEAEPAAEPVMDQAAEPIESAESAALTESAEPVKTLEENIENKEKTEDNT